MHSTPVLPDRVIAPLRSIGSKLEAGEQLGVGVTESARMLNRVDPRDLAQTEREIVEAAALHRWRREPSLMEKLFASRVSDADQLRSVENLEFPFLFHREGRMREAALHKIAEPLPSAFIFATVAWRLNDWAEPVRRAAMECAARTFPSTPPPIIADAASVLLTRKATWGRWGREREVLDAAFERRDVASCLADLIGTSATGTMASLLCQTLRNGSMDVHLQRLSVDAVQPAVRAAAIQSLIRGRAEWSVGWRWRWIDKSMGVRRREPVFETRPLMVLTDAGSMIRLGLADRSAMVRNAAMSGLIQEQTAMIDARELATTMLKDRSPVVRERAGFVIKRADEVGS